jgi:hypothetical protein
MTDKAIIINITIYQSTINLNILNLIDKLIN